MNLTDRLASAWRALRGGAPAPAPRQSESLGTGQLFARADSVQEDAEHGMRALGSELAYSARFDFYEAVRACRILRLRNGLAKSIQRTVVRLAVGDGATITSDREDALEWIERFSEANGIACHSGLDGISHAERILDSLLTSGELILRLEPGIYSGMIYASGEIDVLKACGWEHEDGRPDARRAVAIERDGFADKRDLYTVANAPQTPAQPLPVIIDPIDGTVGLVTWHMLTAPGVNRGVPFLYPAAEYLALLSAKMNDELVARQVATRHFWHVTKEGFEPGRMDEKQKKALMASTQPPRNGQAIVTGNDTAFTPKQFSGSALASEGEDKVDVLRVCRALEVPGVWFGVDVAGGRATGETMADPAERMILNQQASVRRVYSTLIAAALESSKRAGQAPRALEVEDITIGLPPVSQRTIDALAASISTTVGAVSDAAYEGYITEGDAGAIARDVLGSLTDRVLETPDETALNQRQAGNVTQFGSNQQQFNEALRLARARKTKRA